MFILSYLTNVLSSGDWPVFYQETIMFFDYFPYIWSPTSGNGFGLNISFILGFRTFFEIATKFFSDFLNLPWSITEKLIFFIPFWILSITGSFLLSGIFFKKIWQKLLTVIIFSTNTYALMLVGGGQMGVALAYAFSPFVVFSLLRLYEAKNNIIRKVLISSLFSGFLLMLDPRIAGVVLIFIFLFLAAGWLITKEGKILVYILISIFIALLLNSFWILPFTLIRQIPLGEAYTGLSMVEFLSFAQFENTISLLHPNWPENIFGKVYFMKPEFLLIPIIAFSALFCIKKNTASNKIYILSFSLIAIIGAFLAKGTNPPFGIIYEWLFNNIPGFIIFRDSTKWYLLTIISFSILIPFSLKWISSYVLVKINYQKAKYIIFTVFLIYWLFTLRPALTGEVKGTFIPKEIPHEYLKLKDHIVEQDDFFRTLWIPATSRYGYSSDINPSISADNYLNTSNTSDVINFLESSRVEQELRELSIRYIIVPYDADAEIFLDNRKYDNEKYESTLHAVREINWLEELKGFGKIGVFEIENSQNYFWSNKQDLISNVKKINPTKFEMEVGNAEKDDVIIFSENFDAHWYAAKKENNTPQSNAMQSTLFGKNLNSFKLNDGGSYKLEIFYRPQQYVNYGLIISGSVLTGIILILIRQRRKK